MAISQINFRGRLIIYPQNECLNTDHVVSYKAGDNGTTKVCFSTGEKRTFYVGYNEFNDAFTKAHEKKNSYGCVEGRPDPKPI